MAPRIHLSPDGAERLWQRHYKKTHTHTKRKEKRSETEHSSAVATSSAFCIKVITADEESLSGVVYVNDEMMMREQLLYLGRLFAAEVVLHISSESETHFSGFFHFF